MDPRNVRAKMLTITLPANLLGAVITFVYFRYVDYTVLVIGTPRALEFVYFVVVFAALIGLGIPAGNRWTAPLKLVPPPPGPAGDLARRRAVTLPLALAVLALLGWTAAGVMWGIVWPLLAGVFSPARSARLVFAITGVAGTASAAYIFLVAERFWRTVLPAYFPGGDVSDVAGAPRVPVRLRLLAVLLMNGVIPLSVLGMVAYQRAGAALTADAVHADQILGNLLVTVAFIVAVGIATAIGLAFFVAESVAQPLGGLRDAMAEVEHGNLQARCPVVSNDEIGAVTEGFNRMVQGLQEREFLRETFGKYVSQEIRDEILAGRVALEGQLREATILFADLRDFTPWVEASDPREVVSDLNAYFTEMEAAIRNHGGLVLQYIGDEIEAVFGAPVSQPRHAEQAVRAAQEMRARLQAWNAARARAGRPPLRNGIGVHTGTVLAGNIGSADRLSYALVGDPVNVASRIQGLTKELATDVLVSGTTRARLDGGLLLTPLPAVRVKGRTAEIEVYALG